VEKGYGERIEARKVIDMANINISDDIIADVKSRFIKEKIKEGKWKNEEFRQYIKELIFLEKFVLHGIGSYPDGKVYHILKNRYPEEHKAIYKELDPEGFEEFIERERKEQKKREKERKQREEKERREREKGKKAWLGLGGKL